MASNRTLDVKRKKRFFSIASRGVWIVTTIVLAISALSLIGGSGEATTTTTETTEQVTQAEEIITASMKAKIFSLTTSLLIGIIASILIKDKLRTAIWMLDTVLAAIVFKSTGMYIVLAIWAVDEYILFALLNRYKNLLLINKEIDLREGTN